MIYHLDNTEAEASPAPTAAATTKASISKDDDDDSSIADSDEEIETHPSVKHEEPKMEEFANWDDPTTVDWGAEDASKDTTQQIQNTTTTTTTTAAAPISNEQIFKCTACKVSNRIFLI